ncbi:MAG: hypothetical protein S4CHLAM2_05640 [Chlamydiales bacterium]|nr:hypothetical protein [Chlamydiales bacterium]
MIKLYKIHFHKHCLKELEKIAPPFRKSISRKIEALSDDPRPNGCKKLKGSDKEALYRIHAGDYRAVYTIQDEALVVLVVQVGHRRDVYSR